jgi:hypothetical protein
MTFKQSLSASDHLKNCENREECSGCGQAERNGALRDLERMIALSSLGSGLCSSGKSVHASEFALADL